MITNNKGKFTRNISHLEIELGSKNGLFQTVEGDEKCTGDNKYFDKLIQKKYSGFKLTMAELESVDQYEKTRVTEEFQKSIKKSCF